MSRDFNDTYWAEVGNMSSIELRFTEFNWVLDVESYNMHATLRNGCLIYMCNQYKVQGKRVFNGKKKLRLMQGIKITPKLDDKIEPFMVYATNSYGLNRSNLTNTRQSCRFDVVEVSDGNGGSIYRLVLAILSVERKGIHFITSYIFTKN
jgi:hypothetical protein